MSMIIKPEIKGQGREFDGKRKNVIQQGSRGQAIDGK
jgi:hypothetical protein